MFDDPTTVMIQATDRFPSLAGTAAGAASDDQLVAATLAGDESAFAEIFDRHKRHVTRTAARFFTDQDQISECVQQTFTKAYFSLTRFSGTGERSFAGWLTRIAVNNCYDEFRRRRRGGEALMTDLTDPERDHIETLLAGGGISVEDQTINAQLAQRVLSTLSPDDRIAVTLVYSQDRSLSEVADIMGIGVNNLKSRLFRTRKALKKRLTNLFT